MEERTFSSDMIAACGGSKGGTQRRRLLLRVVYRVGGLKGAMWPLGWGVARSPGTAQGGDWWLWHRNFNDRLLVVQRTQETTAARAHRVEWDEVVLGGERGGGR